METKKNAKILSDIFYEMFWRLTIDFLFPNVKSSIKI
jgi:hypothetical protein